MLGGKSNVRQRGPRRDHRPISLGGAAIDSYVQHVVRTVDRVEILRESRSEFRARSPSGWGDWADWRCKVAGGLIVRYNMLCSVSDMRWD